MIGEIVSFAPMPFNGSCLLREPNHGADGYSVMFSYRCGCGDLHYIQALNVWPTGDDKTHIVQHVCPKQQTQNDVELTRTF